MDADQFRVAAHKVIEDVISYFRDLPSERVTPTIQPGYLRPQLPSSAPEKSEPFSAIQEDVSSKIRPGLTHWQHPGFMAFFSAHTTFPSILGEIYSAAFSAPAFNWICSPACTELETVVMDWVCKMLGLPDCFLSDGPTNGGGVIQGSASEAVIPCMVAAREGFVRKALEKEDLLEQEGESEERRLRREDRSAEIRSKLVSLSSEHTHSLAQKGSNILGLRHRSVKAGKESGYAMMGKALRAKIEEVERQGLQPYFVIANLGTTATCSIDDMEGIAAIKRERPDIWVHVDAAYAGAALCCPEVREKAQSKWFGEFDSFDFNMHKWMLVNFDARDWQVPLGRRFRALKIWFVLRTYGVSGIQKMIRKHIGLAEYFTELIKQRPDLFEVVAGPSFALTVIRCIKPTKSHGMNGMVHTNGERTEAEINNFEGKRQSEVSDESNALTKQVCELINSRGQFFLTGAVVNGTYVIRVVSANERAEDKYLKGVFETLVAAVEEVSAGGS